MKDEALTRAIAAVPAGAWAVGVSGGADSVALLRLLSARNDLRLVVAHLNHQTRGEESDADLEFVRLLCRELTVGRYLALREEIEKAGAIYPNNPSAKYRHLRFELFRSVVEKEKLDGVILAHHADDQVETVLQRLLRGSGYSALAGIARLAAVGGLTVLRPLLDVRRESLRAWMRENEYPWREDASNESDAFQRNRVRTTTSRAVRFIRIASRTSACMCSTPVMGEREFANAEQRIHRRFAGRCPGDPGAAGGECVARGARIATRMLDRAVAERLIAMCTDAATPARQVFPGNLSVARRRGVITAQRGAT